MKNTYHLSAINHPQHAEPNTIGQLEIDNHADMTCFGANFLLLAPTGCICDVNPFTDEYDAIPNVEIVSACTAFDHLVTGITYIFDFHEGLWFDNHLTHSLVNPNQC